MLTSLNVEQLANVSYEINNIQFVKMVHEAICQLCLKLSIILIVLYISGYFITVFF